MIGYNTDVFGFETSLKPLLHSSIKKALVLGNGGVTKAVAYVLNKLGIEFLVVSRSPNTHTISYQSIDENILNQYQLIINCTPIGMFPNIDDAPKIPYQFITANHLAFDLIYLPEETLFLKNCKAQGATTKNGLDMLHLQAQKALDIFLQ
jgi:shikimate dehydrogenase